MRIPREGISPPKSTYQSEYGPVDPHKNSFPTQKALDVVVERIQRMPPVEHPDVQDGIEQHDGMSVPPAFRPACTRAEPQQQAVVPEALGEIQRHGDEREPLDDGHRDEMHAGDDEDAAVLVRISRDVFEHFE